ncbi:hypothetical protein C5167_011490 [Papaver somniferum]|uniref:Sulfotransferase n=1 Tax=Papaver somniferum TaxID=3469 RepID=A0A4Y7K627_PAPSO|nr:cytosolic sulfotransferase 8-like [Papaver somniferum]RZC67800.1 hypothetical protein C5167_011490 [Papaver somniferum]
MATSHDENSCDSDLSRDSVLTRHGLGHSVLHQYQGFWSYAKAIENVKDFQQNFNALDTDVIITTLPKSGTTWLKALAFAIVNRTSYSPSSSSSHQHHPLLTTSPHDLVPFVDFKHRYPANYSLLDFTKTSTCHDSPCRLISTHVPYPSLPESIKSTATDCKIVYLCRNPQDNFISLWLFMNKFIGTMQENNSGDRSPPLSIEEAFEYFCAGVSLSGPFWDHVLGYWTKSLEEPRKVLFLKYEDLKKEPEIHCKRLAEFMGCRFSVEEENQGAVDEIVKLCSFQNLKNLDLNKSGTTSRFHFKNEDFYRKGEVGDWKNYLTPPMVERLDRLLEEKLQGSGLVFPN